MAKRTSLSLIFFMLFLEKTIFKLWFVLASSVKHPLKLSVLYRSTKGKEEKKYLSERWGKTRKSRADFKHPSRPVLWFHGASVGEIGSILALASFLNRKKLYNILITTTTCAAKKLIEKYCSENPSLAILHHYAPLDVPKWVNAFLSHWQPAGAIFVESDLWPVRLKLCQKYGIPTFLIGACLSNKSFIWWRHFPFFFRIILNCFSWISARDLKHSKRFSSFYSKTLLYPPLDLKKCAPAPSVNKTHLNEIKKQLPDKKICVIISTHQKEEDFFFRAVKKIKQADKWLFILAPRHTERGKKLSNAANQKIPLRSLGEFPAPPEQFWIIDTIGELGLFLSLADCAFVAGSLYPEGKGHNPYEPLSFHLPTAAGPWRKNWQETYESLQTKITTLSTEDAFADWIENLFSQPLGKDFKPQIEKINLLGEEIHQTISKNIK